MTRGAPIVHKSCLQIDVLGIGSINKKLGKLPHAEVNIMGKRTHRVKEAYNMLLGVAFTAIKCLELGKCIFGAKGFVATSVG